MALSDAYMEALRDFLQDRYENNPPPTATIGTIKVGLYQDDPENAPAVITIHTNNPIVEESTHIEMITDQASAQGFSRHRLWGGYTEMGDGLGAAYWYHWWVRAEYFMTRTGFDQATARTANNDLVRWLRAALNAAKPQVLSITPDDDAVLLETHLVNVNMREHGGRETSYIWSSLFEIKGLVFGD